MLGYLDNTDTGRILFTQGQRIIELAITVINAFISVLLPRIGSFFLIRIKRRIKSTD